MAKYGVTYGCGHEGTLQLFGPTKEREWKIKAAEHQDCPDCYKAKQIAKAGKVESESSLPELQGSEKQVAWAKTIKAKYINEFTENAAQRGSFNAKGQEMLEKMRNQISASWWIENRNENLQGILRKFI